MVIRHATAADAAVIAGIVNVAYEVERFFVDGNRTSVDEVRRLLAHAVFLVAEDGGSVVGCVQVDVHGDRGGFGMLAVAPSAQRAGLGHRLIAAAEAHAAGEGCRAMDIRVVNLRADLLPRYARLGYREVGTEPYVQRPIVQPCHFIVMTKPLTPDAPGSGDIS